MTLEVNGKILKGENTNSSVMNTQSSLLSPHPLFIRIADVTLTISSVDPNLKLRIDGAIHKFLIPEADPDVTPDIAIEARWGDLSTNGAKGKKIFDSGSVWQLYQNNGVYLFSFQSPVFGPTPYKVVHTQKDFARGEATLHSPYFRSDQSIYPMEYPLDELLLTNFLSLGKGVEIHSCGIIDSLGNGRLFAGVSGAGKTTMARLWQDEPGVTILSDDRIVLREVDGRLWMYGTPWHGIGRLASAARAPLTRVYFLQKGKKNGLIPQTDVEAAAQLFACSFVPFYSQKAIDFTLGFLKGIVKEVPCRELSFLPDKRVLELIMSNKG